MFGEYIEELEKGINFDEKEEIIELARVINKNRIKIVHEILYYDSIEKIKNAAKTVKESYEKIKILFNISHENFIDELRKEKEELESVIDMDLNNKYYEYIELKYKDINTHKRYKKYKEERESWMIEFGEDEKRKSLNIIHRKKNHF
ncbi:hypothetical protein K7I13_07275 [Brucepastera parasyntrophica]|uniref:hypothetical protein n=1 Tax=Brucepastera parasyntrophica TaxID=2880008 RepID=UPI00210E1DD3|nr:hypothetical protein [Brucepastera parasyntrophica]ULQ61045.1 hypothetical protein K7I13_07275 [Brucepastera parasyntrophica]